MSGIENLNNLYNQALNNDKKVDKTEFGTLKKEILADSKVTPEERDFIVDKLSTGTFEKGSVIEAIDLLNSEDTKTDKKEEPKKTEEKKSPWAYTNLVQGNFNYTNVSKGWTKQYGEEVSSLKVEGSYEGTLSYNDDTNVWNNKLTVQYGNVFAKGQEKVVSNDNLEFSTELGRKIYKNEGFSLEVPYLSLYTKGPIEALSRKPNQGEDPTKIEGRKFRESTGGKILYDNKEAGASYSLKLGGGMQQSYIGYEKKWKTEPGTEVIVEAKQNVGGAVKSVFNTKLDKLHFLERMELNGSLNAFTPLDDKFGFSTTDVTIKSGAKYFLNDKQNVWLGISKQWEYGGKETNTWEDKTSLDIGLKF